MSVFPKDLSYLIVPTFFIHNSPVRTVKEQCYLGVLLNSAYTDDDDIKKEIRAVYARGNRLLQNFRHCSDDVKGQLFKSYCTTFYCLSLWNNFTRTTMDDIRVSYNNVFRFFFKLPRRGSISYHFVTKDLPHFTYVRRTLCHSMFERVLSSRNRLICNLVDSTFFVSSRVFKHWMDLLF